MSTANSALPRKAAREGETASSPRAERPLIGRQASTIELIGASKVYGSFTAVAPTDLRIEAGEFMTLLGPSGSGKTTTLNMIAGFADLSGGDITIDGRSMASVPAHKRDIGMVFQNYALFPHMDVEANIAFPLARRKIPRSQRRPAVQRILEVVRLEGMEKRFPTQLSGGQQQRVALARALVFEPGVLLLDEPLGALDRNLREWLQIEIKRIHRQVGSTFVFVTHDQEEALALSDRIAVFNNGQIEQVGTGTDLYERPSSLFVGKFIGESSIVRGPLEVDGDDSVMDVQGVRVSARGRLAAGAAGALLLRPESGRLVPEGERVPVGTNALPVTVVEQIYLGSVWKYEIRLPDGSAGFVRHAKGDRNVFGADTAATLVWNPRDAVLLVDE
jgi:putative spermidine/putrescine transport system ATP-binding protein